MLKMLLLLNNRVYYTQLERCQEVDSGRVFEINLNRQSLEQVPSLKEVSRLSRI